VAIVAICDALTDNDLAHIAAAAAAADPAPFFIGTAGLATALAHRIESVSRARVPLAVAKEGALIVAGSRSSATHAAAGELAAVPGVCEFKIPVQFLSRPELSEQRQALGYEITEAIEAGEDVLVSIEPGNDADAAQGSRLVRALAECLLGGMWTMSALVATGGETARALLDALGIDGIHLLDEIEAGISLGLTSGTREFPIVTKAGGFGDAHCLARCLTRLRLIRQTGTLT
jgi:uncharacterized protein YgbK (DUF1537 family)